jgi:hypothetical protein
MPIKNLSDEVRLPRLGKIRLGYRDEAGVPHRTPHFVVPEGHPDRDRMIELFGEEPRSLRVLIPLEDEEKWATQYYRSYVLSRGLVCKGDGETAMQMQDVKTGKLVNKDAGTIRIKEVPCRGRGCAHYRAGKCKESMNLRFILPDVPGLGIWQIDTRSINSILNINSCASLIRKAFGRISMIPLTLSLEPAQVSVPEDGKQQTVYVLNLRTDVTLGELADAARDQARTLTLASPALERRWDAETEEMINSLYGEAAGAEGSQQREGSQ